MLENIIFYIYREKGAPHHLPHVNVKYGEFKANFSIDTGEQLDGRRFPSPQRRVIEKLLSKYKQDLLAFWHNLQQENPCATKQINFTL